MADQWRISSPVIPGAGDQVLTSNWEQVNTESAGFIGSSMTQSSGVFTFPETGIYLITYQVRFQAASGEGDTKCEGRIEISTDGGSGWSPSNFTNQAQFATISGQSPTNSVYMSHILDVTSTANIKARFGSSLSRNDTAVSASSNSTLTGATFIRLGDT